ncbi:hypothetical protein Dimus_016543 [Dionaea muscipula]
MDVGSSHGPLVGEELGGLVCGLDHFKVASHVDGGLPHGVLHGSGEALPRRPDCEAATAEQRKQLHQAVAMADGSDEQV